MPQNYSYRHHRPRYGLPIIIQSLQACRPVYNNQATLDALNAILAGCTKLNAQGGAACSDQFIRDVERELVRQLGMARYIGTSCNQPTLY